MTTRLGNSIKRYRYLTSSSSSSRTGKVYFPSRTDLVQRLIYTFGKANSDTDWAATFPAYSYDLRPEYGRAGFDIRHRVQFSGLFAFPWRLRLSPMLVATSSRSFNITIGRDLNGDTIFTDRPAFATDLSRPSVVRTPFGAFDLAPMPSQTIIPRNYGVGPGLVSLNLRIAKSFKLGKEVKGKRDPMELTFTALSRNLLNHPNLALPDGNLSSPYFGESTALVAGGGNSASGNRRIDFHAGWPFENPSGKRTRHTWLNFRCSYVNIK